MVLGRTWSGSVSVAGPEAAVIVARPALMARSRPSAVTVAMRGLLDVNVTGSDRRSPCRENAAAEIVSREPATRRAGRGSSTMRAAGSGSTCTSAAPNT